MTTFNTPLFTGTDTGVPTTATKNPVVCCFTQDVSAAGKTAQRRIPEGSRIINQNVIIMTSVGGIAAGVNIRTGSTAGANDLATCAVSAGGGNKFSTLTTAAATSVANVFFDATAQASAGDWNVGDFRIFTSYITPA